MITNLIEGAIVGVLFIMALAAIKILCRKEL